MTHAQFAEHIGISPNTFRNWIHYNRVPELTAAYEIAYSLGVSLEYLLGGKDRDMAEMRLREVEARKAAAKIQKMLGEIQKQLKVIRPL